MKTIAASVLVLIIGIAAADARQIVLIGSDEYGHPVRILFDDHSASPSVQPNTFALQVGPKRGAAAAPSVGAPDSGIARRDHAN